MNMVMLLGPLNVAAVARPPSPFVTPVEATPTHEFTTPPDVNVRPRMQPLPELTKWIFPLSGSRSSPFTLMRVADVAAPPSPAQPDDAPPATVVVVVDVSFLILFEF